MGSRIVFITMGVLLLVGNLPGITRAAQPGTPAFQRTWERTDKPVAEGILSRTWMWGPEANYPVMEEDYDQAPGGQRQVQYFDKSRMEVTDPEADSSSVWYVTNGLLVVEMITGAMQIGDNRFEKRLPAAINVAGDGDDPDGPTYATFGDLLDAAPRSIGDAVIQRVDRQGAVTDDLALASRAITIAHIDTVTDHAIAEPFWHFMGSVGTVYTNGQYVTEPLFEDPYFATGRPIAEAYWANVKVGGDYKDVLMQCFERRCLTYTPGNPAGFVIEAGNVGQHYYEWRYGDGDENDNGGDHVPSDGVPVRWERSACPSSTTSLRSRTIWRPRRMAMSSSPTPSTSAFCDSTAVACW